MTKRQGPLLFFGFLLVALLTQVSAYACDHHPKMDNVAQPVTFHISPAAVVSRAAAPGCKNCCGHCACCSARIGEGECCGHCGASTGMCLCGCDSQTDDHRPPASSPIRARVLEREVSPNGNSTQSGILIAFQPTFETGFLFHLAQNGNLPLYLTLQSVRC